MASFLDFIRRPFTRRVAPTVPALPPGDLPLSPPPQTQQRWYQSDLDSAERQADQGDLATAARLMRSARRDGIYSGVLSTRTGGLVRLPRRIKGDQTLVEELESRHDAAVSVLDELAPASELARLAADGIELGIGVAELVAVEGRDHPVLVRRDPEWLLYRWAENRWYYRSTQGLLPIVPGDGRWVLHCPGGRSAPWNAGLWKAIGRAWIRKTHAEEGRDAWQAGLANPAIVVRNPAGASDNVISAWIRKIAQWGRKSVFQLPAGFDISLLESNGRGADSFRESIQDSNEEFIVAVCGQTVTTDGGAGFSNASIHSAIRADLIKETADALAYTINTQVLPVYAWLRYGDDAPAHPVTIEWDVTPPRDRSAEAASLVQLGTAIASLDAALAAHGVQVDAAQLLATWGLPTRPTDPAPVISLAPRKALSS